MNICIHGIASEALMLSSKQFCGVSNGSACNSNSYRPSYVLTAMGIPTKKIENSIRISWGPEIDIFEVEESFTNMVEIAKGF
jgi:cysteine desulfurase